MDAKQLRIGNYLTRDGVFNVIENHLTVCCIDENYIHTKYWSEIDESFVFVKFKQNYIPIPLTKKWLIKFGFEINLEWDNTFFTSINILNGDYVINIDVNAKVLMFNGVELRIYYVHQLQNLYFALTNEDLTINKQ
jgi:hypothetical protein